MATTINTYDVWGSHKEWNRVDVDGNPPSLRNLMLSYWRAVKESEECQCDECLLNSCLLNSCLCCDCQYGEAQEVSEDEDFIIVSRKKKSIKKEVDEYHTHWQHFIDAEEQDLGTIQDPFKMHKYT